MSTWQSLEHRTVDPERANTSLCSGICRATTLYSTLCSYHFRRVRHAKRCCCKSRQRPPPQSLGTCCSVQSKYTVLTSALLGCHQHARDDVEIELHRRSQGSPKVPGAPTRRSTCWSLWPCGWPGSGPLRDRYSPCCAEPSTWLFSYLIALFFRQAFSHTRFSPTWYTLPVMCLLHYLVSASRLATVGEPSPGALRRRLLDPTAQAEYRRQAASGRRRPRSMYAGCHYEFRSLIPPTIRSCFCSPVISPATNRITADVKHHRCSRVGPMLAAHLSSIQCQRCR